MNDETFGQYMRRVRESNHLSGRITAKGAGITVAYLSDIEGGNRKPPADPAIVDRWAETISADLGTAKGLAVIGRADQWAPYVRELVRLESALAPQRG